MSGEVCHHARAVPYLPTLYVDTHICIMLAIVLHLFFGFVAFRYFWLLWQVCSREEGQVARQDLIETWQSDGWAEHKIEETLQV